MKGSVLIERNNVSSNSIYKRYEDEEFTASRSGPKALEQ